MICYCAVEKLKGREGMRADAVNVKPQLLLCVTVTVSSIWIKKTKTFFLLLFIALNINRIHIFPAFDNVAGKILTM